LCLTIRAVLQATPTSPSTPRLRAVGLSCRRGRHVLFRNVDLDVAAGRIVWLRGRNGSGKTSLLRTAAGLLPPARGRIERDASPLIYVGHANALKDDLSVAQALAFLWRLDGQPGEAARVKTALERVGLGARHDAPVRSLSQGQRRRAALARLAADERPALWLLDEPFDALDDDGTRWLNEQLHAHARRGGSVVMACHAGLDAALLEPAVLDLDRHA
jgi:heme exporter protein A